MKITSLSLPLLLSALVLSLPAAAIAQDTIEVMPLAQPAAEPPLVPTTDIVPVKAASDSDVVIDESAPTHPAIKLTPDKSELIRLGQKAATVLVGNPAHLNIVPEGPDTLVLVPRAPGATYFTVLDENNKIIMQRHVIVASPKEKYVRIRKSCASGTNGCQPTQVYYCPDMCHEIILNAGEENQGKDKTAGEEVDEAIAAVNEANDDADSGNDGGEETTEE